MQFLYPALTAGFFLALLPLLIHLINMMRHRRVQWAAMEFLLQSYKKHRKWVWLRQLILLLARMAVVVLIVAMLAQLVTQKRYEGLFGDTRTHHYVLIDDSMSMSDRAGGIDAFEQALRFTRELGAEAARQELRQRFTLIRFSRAQAAHEADLESGIAATLADLNAEDVDSRFPARLEEIRLTFQPTQLSVGPEAALQILRRLISQGSNENRILYLVSDFRTKEWANPRETRELLGELEQQDVQIRLVNCVRSRHANLAITDLQPADETRASGVPLFVNVHVTNYGDQTAEKVPVKVRTLLYESAAKAGEANRPAATVDESPTMEIERIGPGETVSQRVQVYFPSAGKHVVEAVLPEDAVSADNRRWCVIDFPEEETVLVIDGDPGQRNAFYLQAIFQPGQRARTGVRPEVQNAAFLRDVNAESLGKYSAIYLLDVDRLDDRARTNLEAYVQAGGGVAVFVGPQVNIAYYNDQLYRGGAGPFPVLLARDDLLGAEDVDRGPDVEIEATDHPVFQELVQGQNPLVRTLHVERFLRAESGEASGRATAVHILARLRNRSPLAVEKTFGKGRVIAVLTTYAPYWNDMVLGPSVIVALRLQSYLGYARRTSDGRLVKTAIHVPINGEQFRQDVQIFLPADDPAAPIMIDRPAEKQATDARQFLATITPQETLLSGIYEFWFHRVDGSIHADRYAVNVEGREGDLAQTPSQELVTNLEPVQVDVGYADQYESASIEQAGFNQSLLVMGLLLLLLIGEQLLAYLNSFHTHRGTELSHLGRPGHRASIQRLRAQNEVDDLAELTAIQDNDWRAGRPSATHGISSAENSARGVRS
ncbi:MAG: BatA domain-containing protein [Pirellulaceae bacterium]